MPLPVISTILVFWGLTNLVTASLFIWDKRSAQRNQWRVSEQTLLTWSALGGWPAGLVCSRLIRHKTAKTSFRWKFAAAVLANLVALAALVVAITHAL